MRPLLVLFLLTNLLYAELEYKGYVGADSQAYLTRPDDKHPANFTLQQQLELAYTTGDFKGAVTLYAQEDSYDLGDEKNERTFLRPDELYGSYNFDNDMLFLGRNIRFWGALEANNIVDTFNTRDFRTDGLDPQKQGAWNAAYTHYTQSGEIALIVKLYEEQEKMAAYPYVYYFFPKQIDIPPLGAFDVEYSPDRKSQESLYRPTVYLKWSGSTETEYAVDYALVLQHGFDGQRAFVSDIDLASQTSTLSQEVYLVNKAMTYDTMVVGATLLKLEAQVADVIGTTYSASPSGGRLRVGDYYQLGLGVEHTLTAVLNDADLGLIAEYYYYNTFDHSADVADDLALFQVFENDLFLGLRYTFNDISDSSIIAGAVIDMAYSEQSYSVEYETRFFDVLSMKADYAYINPSKETLTAYHLMQRHQRIGINLAYHF